jgi:acyl-CoA synthetase (AMP-forming)/AMP-acid ligase II
MTLATLPKNARGKVDRCALREQFRNDIEARTA